MTCGDLKDLPIDKLLRDKAFNFAKNPKNDGYQRGFASMVYNFFDKKTSNTNKGTGIDSENKELAKEIHKPIIRKFGKRYAIWLIRNQ